MSLPGSSKDSGIELVRCPEDSQLQADYIVRTFFLVCAGERPKRFNGGSIAIFRQPVKDRN